MPSAMDVLLYARSAMDVLLYAVIPRWMSCYMSLFIPSAMDVLLYVPWMSCYMWQRVYLTLSSFLLFQQKKGTSRSQILPLSNTLKKLILLSQFFSCFRHGLVTQWL
jgi:hypothetical protein